MNDAAFDLLAYVSGPYARVEDERDDVALEVTGELPRELFGMFLQNASNPKHAPPGLYHWFDGDGMVHGVWLEDGKATYRNRYVRTGDLAGDEVAGECRWSGILMPFDPGAARVDKDTANTDLVWHAGRLWATSWLSGIPYEIDVPSLRTRGPGSFGGTLPRGLAAHSKVDPRTGELMFLDFDLYRTPHLRHGVVSKEGEVTHLQDLEVDEASLYHDIAITPRFTIVPDFSMRFDADALRRGRRKVKFDKDKPSRFAVVPRHGGPVQWFDASPGYGYHTINAWEEETPTGTVVHLVGCAIDQPVPERPRSEEPDVPRLFFLRFWPFLHQWSFHLGTGKVTERRLDDVATEFPRMDDRRLGVASRLAWSPRVRRGPTVAFDGVVRYDLNDGSSKTVTWGEGRVGTECVFAPRAGGTAEDDGWVLTFTSDEDGENSELVVIDAANPEAGPVARVHLRRRMPVGFHAAWAPGEEVRGAGPV
jgi:carotenoid cleavage dioxygenase